MKKLKNIYEFNTFNVRNKSDLIISSPTIGTILKTYTGCGSLDIKKTIYKDNIRMSGIYR
jgi:hypothetical protein